MFHHSNREARLLDTLNPIVPIYTRKVVNFMENAYVSCESLHKGEKDNMTTLSAARYFSRLAQSEQDTGICW